MVDTLLIHGDSLALPREGVSYEETWPYHVRERLPDTHVVNNARGNNTSESLHRREQYENRRLLEYYHPDTVIVQLGIADCAPRYFRRTEKALLSKVPDICRRAALFVGKRFRSRSQRRAYVQLRRFRSNVTKYLDRIATMDTSTVVIINVLSAGSKYEERNPGVLDAIERYNAILDDVAGGFENCSTLRPLMDDPHEEREIVDGYTIADGYHLCPEGHERLARRLLTHFEKQKHYAPSGNQQAQ